jgi:hypothetical protein
MVPFCGFLHPKIRNNSWQGRVSDGEKEMTMYVFPDISPWRRPNG